METSGERAGAAGAKAERGEAAPACGNVCSTCPKRLSCPVAAMLGQVK